MLNSVRRAAKTLAMSLACLLSIEFISALPSRAPQQELTTSAPVESDNLLPLYDSLALDSLSLSKEAYNLAVQGYRKMLQAGSLQHPGILSILDFSLSSDKKRFFIIDIAGGKLLLNTYAAHGRNSGDSVARSFSNDVNSFKSSLGFYVTGQTYNGEHGYSLRLQGLEKGINDNAYDRNIVVHGASYVNEATISQKGYIGRSLGCPAVPQGLHKKVISLIKDGTCLFLFSPDRRYAASSQLLQPDSINLG